MTSSETEEALRESTGQIVEAVIGVLEQTPPELSADILDRGIAVSYTHLDVYKRQGRI